MLRFGKNKPMPRVHLFEFEDQPWFPDVFRKGITDYLQYAANKIDLYKPVIPVIRKGLEKSGSTRIVDICSGGGGGISKVFQYMKSEYQDTKVVLTDKYPNLVAFKNLSEHSNGDIDYVANPVDAVDVPKDLEGFRTQFVSFHHFRPAQAKRILENAAHSNAAIGIFEATERSFVNFIAMLFTPIVVMLAVPFIRPFSFSRLFFTYVIPAIPLFTMWDGMVSVLRTYSEKELQKMTASINAPGYTWEIGTIKHNGAPHIVYLLGYPEKETKAAA